MVDIEMYYRDFCGFCARADRLLQSKNVEYRRINIWEVDGAKEEMVQRSDGRSTVPQIFVNGALVGGSDDLVKHFEEPEPPEEGQGEEA